MSELFANGFIRDLAYRRAGLALSAEKDYFVESRLLPLMRQEGLPTLYDLVEVLRREGDEGPLARRVVESLLVTETQFYRDGIPFELLRQHVVPRLLADRAAHRTLDLWCAAASSGQEPYSVLMLLRESFPELAGWRVRFLASDISEEMLERARRGEYTQHEVNRGLPAALLVKYFERRGLQWCVKEDLKRAVEFRRVNLLEPLPDVGLFDLILIRNVLIYFDVPTKKRVLERVRAVLRPHGRILLGGAETSVYLDDELEPEAPGTGVCYRLREASP